MELLLDPLFGAACALIVVTAILRLRGSRDAEGRRLYPNAVILITYVFIHLVLFVSLSISLSELLGALGASYQTQLRGVLSFLELTELVGDNPAAAAPVLVFFLFMVIDTFAPLRSLDEGLRSWLFENSHRNDDFQELVTCLVNGPFQPSEIERTHNVATLREHHIFLTDDDTRFIDGSTNNLWRKASTLLRHLENWRGGDQQILSSAEEAELRELIDTHRRKTRHAMNLLRIVVRAREGEAGGERAREIVATAINRMTDQSQATAASAAEASGSDPFLPAADPSAIAGRDADRPVLLSPAEFADHLRSIQGYFSVEYQLLLQRIARLTARSVIFSGDRGPQRFQEVKRTGFGGLGYLEPFNFNWILWAFLFIGLGALLIVFAMFEWVIPLLNPEAAARRAAEGGGPPKHLFMIIPLQMAFATLAGAIVGSNRRLARNGEGTPWVAFFGAGLATLLIWLILQESASAIFAPTGEAAAGRAPRTLANVWPFAAVPVIATLGIARLSHLRWPWSRGVQGGSSWSTRLADMVAMMAIMTGAYMLSFILHQIAGTSFGVRMAEQDGSRMFLFAFVMGGLLGALIGSVVSDVRRAARSEITLTDEVAADLAYDERRAGALPAQG